MVIAERADTPTSILEEPPLEKRGVITYEATNYTNKIIIIPPFTEEELDRINFARSNREFLDLNARDNNFACIFYGNSGIPWGTALLNRAKAITQINCVLKVSESALKNRSRAAWNKQSYIPVFGIANYVRGALKYFEAKTPLSKAA